MGSRLNYVDGVRDEVMNPKQPALGSSGNQVPLTRQNSVFSLTFDEFQNSWGGGIGKDFGSMNMDELLKNIWSAEENQTMMSNNNNNNNNTSFNNGSCGNSVVNGGNNGLAVGVVGGGEVGGGFYGGAGLQRQGSITLPRTISQKRVDDVWKELMKEDDIGTGVDGNGGTSGVPQRQQTLGEMTLEEFLVRAGVVREEPVPVERVDNNFNGGFYGFGGNAGLGGARNGFGSNQPQEFSGNGVARAQPLQMQQPLKVQRLMTTQAQPLQMQQPQHLMTTQAQPLQMQQPQHLMTTQAQPLQMQQPQKMQQLMTTQAQPLQMQQAQKIQHLLTTQAQPLQMQQPQKVQQPQQLIQKQERPFANQTTIAFSNAIDVDHRSQPAIQYEEVKPSLFGIRDRPMNNNLLQAVDFKTGVTVAAVSPGSQLSPDLTPKSGMDASLSPVPYMFGRVRKTGAVLEKVIERRQKRMIKNRESAARSRARKQAYTLELEAEVAQLKELNEELQKKQVEIMEKQKKQLMEPLYQPWGCKRQCLRRTLTGPW